MDKSADWPIISVFNVGGHVSVRFSYLVACGVQAHRHSKSEIKDG
jgi:hypothetical protein